MNQADHFDAFAEFKRVHDLRRFITNRNPIFRPRTSFGFSYFTPVFGINIAGAKGFNAFERGGVTGRSGCLSH